MTIGGHDRDVGHMRGIPRDARPFRALPAKQKHGEAESSPALPPPPRREHAPRVLTRGDRRD
jgi:hypothetical protein